MLGLRDRPQERRERPDRPRLDLRQWPARSLAAIAHGCATGVNGYVTRRCCLGWPIGSAPHGSPVDRVSGALWGAEEAGSGERAGRVDEHDDLTVAVLC